MIPIQNIYYMLSYAFQVLKEQGYKKVETEEFENTAELCASILAKGISLQIKRGILREYIPVAESRSALRGKSEISESVKNRTVLKKQLICSFDEFSVNAYMNRIIKSTVMLLLSSDIKKPIKKELRRLMVYFGDVETIGIHRINWNIHYNRNNKTYHMLISVCYLVIKGLLQTQSDGTEKLMDFLDEQRMCRLYEKFILEYYRKEFPKIKAEASLISWQLDNEADDFLPVMRSDIMLSYGNKTLIIDAKFYNHAMQTQFDKTTVRSAHLYQIFTYVKNKQLELGDKNEVSGMLLYAGTDEVIQPDCTYHMSGNKIDVKTLDLNCNFSAIAEQLNKIAGDYFVGGQNG
ncbi:MAG: 5-methylcytosine-specific restriction endonuclease system specificity protein McrC [Eubacterium sp.]|nr:5-methylcytosine-specific restriction endonuclease system specificity protein McrC [Eubacterium sp.]